MYCASLARVVYMYHQNKLNNNVVKHFTSGLLEM